MGSLSCCGLRWGRLDVVGLCLLLCVRLDFLGWLLVVRVRSRSWWRRGVRDLGWLGVRDPDWLGVRLGVRDLDRLWVYLGVCDLDRLGDSDWLRAFRDSGRLRLRRGDDDLDWLCCGGGVGGGCSRSVDGDGEVG